MQNTPQRNNGPTITTDMAPSLQPTSPPPAPPPGTDNPHDSPASITPIELVDLTSIGDNIASALSSVFVQIIPLLLTTAVLWALVAWGISIIRGKLNERSELTASLPVYGADGMLTDESLEQQHAQLRAMRRRQRMEAELEAYDDSPPTDWSSNISDKDLASMGPLQRRAYQRMNDTP